MIIIEHSPLVRIQMIQQQQQHCCDRDAESRRGVKMRKDRIKTNTQQSETDEDLQRMADDASIWEDADAAVVFVPVNN